MKNKKLITTLLLLILAGMWFARDSLKQFPLFSSLFTLVNPAEEVSETGLLRHYSMKTTGATTVIDETASANATLSGATPKPGIIGQALDFDGTDDYVDTGSDMIGTGDDSISAWIYLDSYGELGEGWIIGNGKFIFGVGISSGTRVWSSSDGGSTARYSATGSVLTSAWYHVAVTRTSAGVVNFYVNGVLSGTANQDSGTPAAGTTNAIIGSTSAQNRTFDGRIDEVRLYNRVLTAAEITELYTQGNRVIANGSTTKGLLAHYSLAEEDLVSASIINDLTPNGRDGTITPGASAGFVADQAGVAARAYDFDNADSKIDAGADYIGTSAASISAWIYADGYGEGTIGRIVGNGKTVFYISSTYGLRFNGNGAGAGPSGPEGGFPLNAWYHVVGTRTVTGVTNLYINGVRTGSANQAGGTPVAGTTNVIIGNDSAGSASFNGAISDLRIYNRVLTAAEIANLYQSYHPQGSTGSLEKGLIAHYPLSSAHGTNGTTDLLRGWDLTSGWTTDYASVIDDANTFHVTANYGYIEKDYVLSVGGRYRMRIAGTVSTGTLLVGREGGSYKTGLTGTFDEVFDFTASTSDHIILQTSTSGAVVDITSMTLQGVKAADTTPNARHGALYPGASAGYSTDQRGEASKAYDFDGLNTMVSTTLTSNTPFSNGFTISMWVYPRTKTGGGKDTNAVFISKSNEDNPTEGFKIGWTGAAGQEFLIAGNGSSKNVAVGINLNEWVHVVTTVNSSNLVAGYKNGVYSAGGTLTGLLASITSSAPVIIGSNFSQGRTFNGIISDVRIYNRVLSTDEIQLLYEQKE